jgi:hypothetical protein
MATMETKRLFPWALLEQFQLERDRKAILKLKKLLAFLVWSTSATVDDALDRPARPPSGSSPRAATPAKWVPARSILNDKLRHPIMNPVGCVMPDA